MDVFAEEKFEGNQLAVFLDAGSLSADEMQKLANETHFSETTFILSDRVRDGGYDVRIFTPEDELPFAGHPTLGTAYIIMNKLMESPRDEVRLNLGVGQITVTLDKKTGALWMKQVEPRFLRAFDGPAIADILGISPNDIDGRFPIQEVSTGIPFIIVPLKGLAAVKRAYLDPRKFMAYMGEKDSTGILVFSPETYKKENGLNVRVFTKFTSIPEDPATGSGNGCLAAYLVKHRYFGAPAIDIRTEQGYEMGRPSLLFLRAEEKDGSIAVRVGGRAIAVARGQLDDAMTTDGDRRYTAYCGLYCKDCIPSDEGLFKPLDELRESLDRVGFDEYARLKARTNPKFNDYPVFREVLEEIRKLKCDKYCREGGCKPGCKVRECAIAKGHEGCWECTAFKGCELLGPLKEFHPSLEHNVEAVREHGIDGWSGWRGKHYKW